ncbi:MAG: YbjQ family protein [Candidatus Sumerlaeia bacterium]|nr:YbjQ family protein [Candidatus Sumerlaeia bacterium]
MMLLTTETVPGHKVVRVCGLAKGCSVRALPGGDDVVAYFKNIVGGELHEYTAVIAQTREQALDRLIEDARSMGADAVVGLRFTTTEVAHNAAELLVYGTAVKLEEG